MSATPVLDVRVVPDLVASTPTNASGWDWDEELLPPSHPEPL